MGFIDNTIVKIKDKFGMKPSMKETSEAWGSLSTLKKEIAAVNDDLVSMKGAEIYARMKHDPDVKIGLTIKAMGVLAGGWQLTPGADKEALEYAKAVEQMEFVQQVFSDMAGSLEDHLESIISDALAMGIGIAEKNYTIADGRVVFSSIKDKDPVGFIFTYDDYMNLTGMYQQLTGKKNDLDVTKFTFFAVSNKYGNMAGDSDFRTAYKYWWMKDKLSQWMMIHSEKYAMPTPKGSYTPGLDEDQKTEILKVLSNLKNETALLVPETMNVELLESKTNAQSIFLPIIEWCGKQIIRSILGQTLTTDEGQRTGSLALGQVHQDILTLYFKRLIRKIQEYVNEQLIRDLIDYNFAERYYPNFMLQQDEEDVSKLSEIIYRLVTADVVNPSESWIREYLGLPDKPKEIVELESSQNDEGDIEPPPATEDA